MTGWSTSHASEPSRAEMWRREIRLVKTNLTSTKSTFSHPNMEYLLSHLCLRKFRQCKNSTFRTSMQRDLHEPIRLKTQYLHFLTPKQVAKNAEKCVIDSFSKAEDDPTKLDNFHELFSHNKTSGLWLSVTVTHFILHRWEIVSGAHH